MCVHTQYVCTNITVNHSRCFTLLYIIAGLFRKQATRWQWYISMVSIHVYRNNTKSPSNALRHGIFEFQSSYTTHIAIACGCFTRLHFSFSFSLFFRQRRGDNPSFHITLLFPVFRARLCRIITGKVGDNKRRAVHDEREMFGVCNCICIDYCYE